MILYLFWALAIGGCGYAALVGGRDGRWAAFLILSASILSVPAILLGRRWQSIEIGLLVVDALLLIGLYLLSLRSVRFFPIWMTGFQAVAVTTHIATLIAPEYTPRIYQALEQCWAVPIILAMMMGISLDLKADRRRPDLRHH